MREQSGRKGGKRPGRVGEISLAGKLDRAFRALAGGCCIRAWCGLKKGIILELWHGIPVALRHVGAAEFGVMAFPDLDRIIKPFP